MSAGNQTTITLDDLMSQAQVFASGWSLVGGQFDSGNALEEAKENKAELRRMIEQYTLKQRQPQWVSVSESLPDVPEGDEQEVIVCVRRAHNGQPYVFSARYLNKFPLHNECHPDADEDGCLITTGWHDVKEHSEYDGWYSPLIEAGSGDEVTHWMPLPAAPEVHA